MCRTGAPPLGARLSARTATRERSGRSGGVTRVGPGRSVDNGLGRSAAGGSRAGPKGAGPPSVAQTA
ncbi:Hypothetical protein SLIV_30648 [Streptomyces lividans TK24]|uniref:Uncharacterized protein n=1 Tax=Streptomyces lividans TK24 TaxID=457428 RepID=A0ABX6TPI7_STRLI|nr:Hypothetical protein SLIV_30648 [Streptomyces lividans TK24]QSJ12622.1 Hypothetical protein SLIVDG2_30648 [Streptomyces lividans]QTD73532.1 Hypothetical protein SLIVYQS_30648 [Streptomyces lividans TK24] [Streptomyces lividans]